MQCANPECRRDAQDLQKGTLRLLEMDVPPEKRVVRSDSGFPICMVPSRYFWLCAECSHFLKIKRWTTNGLILEQVQNEKAREITAEIGRFPPEKQALPHRLRISSHCVA